MDQNNQDAASALRNASFSAPVIGNAPTEAPSATDVLAGAFDPTRLHPLAHLSDQLDYLAIEDNKTSDLPGATTALPSRGWTDDLCYGTGTTYLSGLAVGGLWGFREGSNRPLAAPSARLRLNSILNSVTRRGTFIGNSAGVVAIMYNIVNSSIDNWRGQHDMYGSMAAGAISGALFKSTAGIRPMAAAATLGTGLAGIWSYVKRSV